MSDLGPEIGGGFLPNLAAESGEEEGNPERAQDGPLPEEPAQPLIQARDA